MQKTVIFFALLCISPIIAMNKTITKFANLFSLYNVCEIKKEQLNEEFCIAHIQRPSFMHVSAGFSHTIDLVSMTFVPNIVAQNLIGQEKDWGQRTPWYSWFIKFGYEFPFIFPTGDAISTEKIDDDSYYLVSFIQTKEDSRKPTKDKRFDRQMIGGILCITKIRLSTDPSERKERIFIVESTQKVASYQHLPPFYPYVKTHRINDNLIMIVAGAKDGSLFDVYCFCTNDASTSKKCDQLCNMKFHFS